MKLGTLIKGIIIYIIFILGLAILSEWMCNDVVPAYSVNVIETNLDSYLESIKQEIKNQYINKATPKMKEYFSTFATPKNVPKNPDLYNIPEGFPGNPVTLAGMKLAQAIKPTEQFVSYTDNYDYSDKDFKGVQEEDEIVKQVSQKLAKNNYFALQNISGTQYTLGHDYSRIDQFKRTEDKSQPLYTELHKNFKVEDKTANWELPQTGMILPKKDVLNVDYKYDYKYSLPEKLTVQPVGNPYNVPFAYIRKY
jgi:hypothetical protein